MGFTIYYLFLSSATADDAHHSTLSLTDVVKQRTVGRTGELTRATLDTTHDVLTLCTFPILHLRDTGKQIGL